MFRTSYSHGDGETETGAAGSVGEHPGDRPAGLAPVLPQGEPGAGREGLRPQGGTSVPAVLPAGAGAAQRGAGGVFSDAADRLLRGHRLGARHCLASGRFAVVARVSGLLGHRADAGSFLGIANAAAAGTGDTSGGVSVVRAGAGRRGPAGGADGGHRCDDAGGQCGDAVDSAAGRRTELRRVSDGSGAGGRHRGARSGSSWRGWIGSGRRRPPTRSGRAPATRMRGSRR